jgi:hypothetical protein
MLWGLFRRRRPPESQHSRELAAELRRARRQIDELDELIARCERHIAAGDAEPEADEESEGKRYNIA